FDVFAGKKSAQIREILISESAWEEMTCLFAPSLDAYERAWRKTLKAKHQGIAFLYESENHSHWCTYVFSCS
ncbi:hypothetical protein ACRWXV_23805, partial [Escherichia coli]